MNYRTAASNSTFMSYFEFMLNIAQIYVQFSAQDFFSYYTLINYVLLITYRIPPARRNHQHNRYICCISD